MITKKKKLAIESDSPSPPVDLDLFAFAINSLETMRLINNKTLNEPVYK